MEQVQGAIIAAIVGLGSALLVWLANLGWQWLHRPNIKIEVGQGEGFVSEAPTEMHQFNSSTGASFVPSVMANFVRVRVTNASRRLLPDTAKACVGHLASVSQWDDSKADFVPTKYHDFLPLSWSYNPGTRTMDLLHDTPHWLDLCYTKEHADGFFLMTQWQANRYLDGFKEPGFYRFTIQLSGENTDPQQFNVYFGRPQDWKRLQVMDEAKWQRRKAELTAHPTSPPHPHEAGGGDTPLPPA